MAVYFSHICLQWLVFRLYGCTSGALDCYWYFYVYPVCYINMKWTSGMIEIRFVCSISFHSRQAHLYIFERMHAYLDICFILTVLKIMQQGCHTDTVLHGIFMKSV